MKSDDLNTLKPCHRDIPPTSIWAKGTNYLGEKRPGCGSEKSWGGFSPSSSNPHPPLFRIVLDLDTHHSPLHFLLLFLHTSTTYMWPPFHVCLSPFFLCLPCLPCPKPVFDIGIWCTTTHRHHSLTQALFFKHTHKHTHRAFTSLNQPTNQLNHAFYIYPPLGPRPHLCRCWSGKHLLCLYAYRTTPNN